MRKRVGLLSIAVLALSSCGDPGPTGPGVSTPPTMTLEVFDAQRDPALRVVAVPKDLAPDYTAGDQAAWRLARLFGDDFRRPRARLEVTIEGDGPQSKGVSPIADTQDRIWIVRWNRKKQVVLDQVDPADPFPAHHGRGGNRGRGGTSLRGVTGLRLVFDLPVPRKTDMQDLELIVDGEHRSLSIEDLAEVEALEVLGDSGKGKRDAWSLRTLAAHLAGEQARVTELRGEGGQTVALSTEAWADAGRTPVIRLNRRGRFKFHWTGADLVPLRGGELRNVTTLVISTK